MRITYIYGLRDPRDGMIYYVGKANSPKARLQQHMECIGANKNKNTWLSDLVTCGLKPMLDILEAIPLSEWKEAECRWIDIGRSEKWPLTNISSGGGGGTQNAAYVSPWIAIVGNYLMPHERPLFAKLPEDQQFVICHNAAKAMMYHSFIAIKMRGGKPEQEFDGDKAFWNGSRVARRLLHRIANRQYGQTV